MLVISLTGKLLLQHNSLLILGLQMGIFDKGHKLDGAKLVGVGAHQHCFH
jgi:hypothetical protein